MLASVVIFGDGIGKLYGYPTANLEVKRTQVPFTPGVYAAWATMERVRYPAALVIQSEPWKVEVHLLDYSGPDFYGAFLSVDPIQKISEIERYDSTAELKEKIINDLELIREFLREWVEKK